MVLDQPRHANKMLRGMSFFCGVDYIVSVYESCNAGNTYFTSKIAALLLPERFCSLASALLTSSNSTPGGQVQQQLDLALLDYASPFDPLPNLESQGQTRAEFPLGHVGATSPQPGHPPYQRQKRISSGGIRRTNRLRAVTTTMAPGAKTW